MLHLAALLGQPEVAPQYPHATSNATFETELARVRAESAAPSNELERLYADLDKVTGRQAAMLRLGSVAAHRAQTEQYTRIARSRAGLRTICEVGFNSGHSAALWLSASPGAKLVTFDLFRTKASQAALRLLRARFPGRISAHTGDSLDAVPRASFPPCDLVHVDGKHDYVHVLLDFLTLEEKASEGALFLFDDQCDPQQCDDRMHSSVTFGPTLATCDLVQASRLALVESSLDGPRGWALFRRGSGSRPASRPATGAAAGAGARQRQKGSSRSGPRPSGRALAAGRPSGRPASKPGGAAGGGTLRLPSGLSLPVLPCKPMCRLRWTPTSKAAAQTWINSGGRAVTESWQRQLRPREDCPQTYAW